MIDAKAREIPTRPRPKMPFRPGDRVFHQKFGYGTVLSAEADKLSIDFDVAGEKRVMDSFVVPADRAG